MRGDSNNLMLTMLRAFVKHPESVGETYGEHFVMAGTFGLRMVFAGLGCLVHALLPFLFEQTGSRCINQLHGRMAARRPASLPSGVSSMPRVP